MVLRISSRRLAALSALAGLGLAAAGLYAGAAGTGSNGSAAVAAATEAINAAAPGLLDAPPFDPQQGGGQVTDSRAVAGQTRGGAADGQGAARGGARGAARGGARGAATPARGGRGGPSGIYKTSVQPNWFDNNTKFWYRNTIADGGSEFILVDADKGTRKPAFDHEKLAKALSDAHATTGTVDAKHLPFTDIKFGDGLKSVSFTAGGKTWKADLGSYNVTQQVGAARVVGNPQVDVADSLFHENEMSTEVAMAEEFHEADYDISYAEKIDLEATDVASPSPYTPDPQQGGGRRGGGGGGRRGGAGRGQGGGARGANAGTTGTQAGGAARGGNGGGFGRGFGAAPTEANPAKSSDGKYSAFVKDNNLYLAADGGAAKQLTTDGAEGNAYGRFSWAGDGKSLLVWQIKPAVPNPVYLINSSPKDPNNPNLISGPAQLQQRNYPQAGNVMTVAAPSVVDLAAGTIKKLDIDPTDFKQTQPRWNADGYHFTYEFEQRGHQRFRVVEVDTHAATVRTIIDENVLGKNSFIWTDHTATGFGLQKVTYLDATNEIIFDTETDGWRHLHLIDAKTGKEKNVITKGDWAIRNIDFLDTEKRVLWFRATGVFPNQDPYFLQYGRVNFDGTGLTWLTAGDGTHDVVYSPDYKYLIDSYSRVDMPPVNELRRVSDGKLVTKLEESDVTEAKARGTYNPPKVFTAKARDGKTDIWGFVMMPPNPDASHKYPIIEDIYAGPHSSFAPKTWGGGQNYANWNAMGFVVVKLDGMGTANRSKAFHDVAWRNVMDAGFPDRIIWIKEAAKKYPFMDTDRVGIYGTSAGGQSTLAALLTHPEFYKVGVANSGCHDNRIDKSSWNEQWMGNRMDVWADSPDNWFSKNSNVDNATKLQGHLQLVVAELDTNVPPESTWRVVDRLTQAGKEFDLVMVPGADHGAASPITGRKRDDFMKKWLLGTEVPNYNDPNYVAPGRGGRGAGRGGRGGRGAAPATPTQRMNADGTFTEQGAAN